MKRQREVNDAYDAWRATARQLDASIGVELRGGERSPRDEILDIRRFRDAVAAERQARRRYVTALRAANKRVPDELVWDLSDADNT